MEKILMTNSSVSHGQYEGREIKQTLGNVLPEIRKIDSRANDITETKRMSFKCLKKFFPIHY